MAKRKSVSKAKLPLVTSEQIDGSILIVRGHKALLDEQLAAFYGVETKRMMEAESATGSVFPMTSCSNSMLRSGML